MQRIERIIIVVLFVALLWVWKANAGDPAGPGTAPDSTNWYTIDAIYERLNAGTDGSQSAFSDPTSAPGTATMKTLNDVMDKAPAKDDTNGATTADVVSGKTFWGLNASSGQWGQQTGTANEGSNVTGTDGNLSMTIPDGFYSDSKTATAQDSDLTRDNIKKDVEIFGVTGTFEGGPTCSLNGTRWCDNEDGTVTDMTTGLIWLKKADWGGIRPLYASDVSTENAYDRASLLKAGADGAELADGSVEGDWRLPTKSELQGLTTGDEAVSSGNMRAFSGVQPSNYWSSSTSSGGTDNAWGVILDVGAVGYGYKTFEVYVWPVRGGQ